MLLEHVGDHQGSVNNTVDGMWMGCGWGRAEPVIV